MQTKMLNKIKPRPSEYAEKHGRGFIESQSQDIISDLGQYFTPITIAKLIAKNFDTNKLKSTIKILDPGAGSGVLSCALCEELANKKNKPVVIELTAYEIDSSLIPTLKKSYANLKRWLSEKKIILRVNIYNKDFVLENAEVLNQTFQKQLFDSKEFEQFDLVVANPPYFKISKSDPRATATSSIIHGQPNIYALFMALASALLKEGGQLGFITPRSYTSGLYFKKFRQKFFNEMTPFFIHIFESRDKAFNKDGVLQENVILHAVKTKITDTFIQEVKISSCSDLSDIKDANEINIPLSEIMSHQNGYVLHIPTQTIHREIVKLINSWDYNLHTLDLEVSTGPIVAFRSKKFLESDETNNPNAPLLWLHNVKPMQVNWPIDSRKPKYIQVNEEAKKLLLPNNNYILVRRFSAKEEKKRLVAAPLMKKDLKAKFVGIENHINYIYRKNGGMSEIETIGLAAILNSSLLDSYFRIFNGNTQVSATELRNFPLPSPHIIRKVGTIVNKKGLNDEKIVNVIKQYG